MLRIEGGHPVGGTIRPRGNKNAALPMIAACLLTDQPVTLTNVPDIGDVNTLLHVLEELGVTITRDGRPDAMTLCAADIGDREPDATLCSAIRASVLLAGPLLGRRGHVSLPPPGGDVIGRRRLDTHVLALEALGATFEGERRLLHFRSGQRLQGADIFLDEASVTATENAILASVLAAGTTKISNAAGEPHVQDLCELLRRMGANIEGAGTNSLLIEGVASLGGAEIEVGPDYVEVGSLAALAAVTGGELRLLQARPDQHRATRIAFGRLGIHLEEDETGTDLLVSADQELTVKTDLGGAIPKIEDSPWPGFPADLTSIAVVAATQAHGTVLVHEKMFESRLVWIDRLISMGARIVLCDPHRCVVTGPAQLIAQDLVSPDIRAGMALLIAALAAEGTSTIHNVHQIDRGYERIDERLRSLGAHIRREEEV